MPPKPIFPGSFDPITLGHVATVRLASRVFGGLTIVVAQNLEKNSLFTFEQRMDMTASAVKDIAGVSIDSFSGLLSDYIAQNGVGVVIRGVRNSMDFEYETQMSRLNAGLTGAVTLFFPSDPRYSHISSTMARQVAVLGGDVSGLVPSKIAGKLKMIINEQL